MLFLGFAAHTIDPQNRLHVTLVDGWRVQYGFGGPGQAHGQTCSAHQDTCHTWCVYTTHTHRHTRVKKALSMKKSGFLSMHFKMSSAWPASAGWNGPDPVRFFTGRAGTLQQKRLISFKVRFYRFSCFMHFPKWTNLHCTLEEQKLRLLCKSPEMSVCPSTVRVICSDQMGQFDLNTNALTRLDLTW